MAVRPRSTRGRGRHFLRSSRLAAELVRAAGIRRGDLVLDLGAGTGALTAALTHRTTRVVAIEIDPELAAGLRRRFELEVRVADALRVPLPSEPFKVVANLPFDGATAILRIVRRDEPLVPPGERRAYAAFLARAYRDGPRAVVPWRQLKRCVSELGFDRHAHARDLDARQWAELYWRSVRMSR